jgi:uracil-DNA glycosylase
MTEPLGREERDAALPTARTIDELRELATACRACDLWARATQTLAGRPSTPSRR